MLFYEEEAEVAESEERVEEIEEEEPGEIVLEQLKLLVNVTKTWQRVLQGLEPLESVISLLQPQTKPTSKKASTKAPKRKAKPKKSKTKRS